MDLHPVVFLLDDELAVVQALERLLRARGFAVRAWTCARQFLQEHDSQVPGCLVCDMVMPVMSGLELQLALQSQGWPRQIIFITGLGDIPMSVRAMRAGAVSFLPKPIHGTKLLSAVNEALARDAIARVDHRERLSIERRITTLTPREYQVLELVSLGRLNKQIAAELGTAEKTVKVHRGRVMEKMQVRSVAGLVTLLSRWRHRQPARSAAAFFVKKTQREYDGPKVCR